MYNISVRPPGVNNMKEGSRGAKNYYYTTTYANVNAK